MVSKEQKKIERVINFMKKGLIIVESPTKVKNIQQYVGSDYIVESSKGHCIDLPAKGLGIDVDKDFTPTYEVISSKKGILDKLQNKLQQVKELILATDRDREGEAMASLLVDYLDTNSHTVSRITFNEITQKAQPYDTSCLTITINLG